MSLVIDGIDFNELEAEKYWSIPKNFKEDKKTFIKNCIFSGEYVGAEKIDGQYGRFVKDLEGNCYLQSRSLNVEGEYPNKYDWLPHLHSFFESLPVGTCLLGEVYLNNHRGSKFVTSSFGGLLSTSLKKQEIEKLSFYIFDIWAFNCESFLNKKIEERISTLNYLSEHFTSPYIRYAKYYSGERLWEELGEIRNNKNEGVVITHIGTPPSPGKRTARKTIKVKQELDTEVDCFLTGNYKLASKDYTGKDIEDWTYWRDARTGEKFCEKLYDRYMIGDSIYPITKANFYGWATAIEIGVIKDGTVLPIGWISGITDEIKEKIVSDNNSLVHRVVKINGMSFDKNTNRLRHGKIIEWRVPEDKSWKDCFYEQFN
jgi:hypothetical protein